MARTHLKVLRGRHGSYEVATRELTSKGKAPESIDPSVIVRRARAAEVAQNTLASGYSIPTKKGKKSLRVFFTRPILARDFKYIEESAVAAGLLTAATQMPDETVKCGSFRFLTETSKMGCYSFNLPAGPTVQGGTCPASSLGFMYLSEGELREQRRLTPMPISVPDFICNGCVVGDTRVLVRDRGLVEVAKLEQEAQSFEVWSGKAWRSSRAVFTGFKPVFELTTSWGSQIQLTADHQVLTEDRGWVEAQDLEEGDRLVFEPPNAHHVPPATINFVDENDHHNARPTTFPDVWSAEVGAVLGYLLGDGSVTQGKYPSVSVVFAERDVDAAQRLQKIISRWVDTETQLRRFEEIQSTNDLTGEISSVQYGLHWRVKGLAEFLTHLGIDKSVGCDNLRAPSRLWEAGSDAVRGFLSGLFGSDGSVGSSGQKIEVSLASTSLGLLGDVQQMLFSFFGIRSTMTTYSSNEKRGYKPLFKLCINSDHHVRKFATDVGFFTPRKQSLLLKLCEDVPEAATPRRLPTVKSLEKVSDLSVPVFDLQVDTDHAFVANNVTIHNCYALKSGYAYTSTVLIQALQLELVKLWLREGTFASYMVTFIRAGQEASLRSMKRTPRELWHNIPNPNFFRIHDAGDMFNRRYFDAWVDICKSLPDVYFWAPTRMWALPGAAGVRFGKGLPPNLALRPSSLHWRTEPPPVQSPGTVHASLFGQSFPMLSAGSGSGVHAPAGVWECPAYEHMTKLGGSVSKLGPEGQELRDKKGELLTKDGNCGRAHGPNSPARGGSDPQDLPEAQGGHGCRACWINKDVPIYYHEH